MCVLNRNNFYDKVKVFIGNSTSFDASTQDKNIKFNVNKNSNFDLQFVISKDNSYFRVQIVENKKVKGFKKSNYWSRKLGLDYFYKDLISYEPIVEDLFNKSLEGRIVKLFNIFLQN